MNDDQSHMIIQKSKPIFINIQSVQKRATNIIGFIWSKFTAVVWQNADKFYCEERFHTYLRKISAADKQTDSQRFHSRQTNKQDVCRKRVSFKSKRLILLQESLLADRTLSFIIFIIIILFFQSILLSFLRVLYEYYIRFLDFGCSKNCFSYAKSYSFDQCVFEQSLFIYNSLRGRLV